MIERADEAIRSAGYAADAAAHSPHRRYDLVLSDNDGCLVSESTAPFDDESLAKLAALNRRAQTHRDAPVLTLCSGRPQPFVEAMCRALANLTAPAVAENGVWLYHPGPNIYEADPAITPEHLRLVRSLEAWLLEEFGPAGRQRHGCGIALQPGKHASCSIYHPDAAYVKQLLPRLQGVLMRGKRGSADAPPPKIATGMFRVAMTEFYINCDLAHVSKGTGLDRLLAHTKTPRDRLAGIGDMPGDMPIRERVEFFACPANAHEEIKRVADYVSPLAEARGVVDIMDRLSQD